MEAAPAYQAERVRTTVNLEQVGLRLVRWGLILCLLFIGLASSPLKKLTAFSHWSRTAL
jgi:hypothetical protein